MRFFQADKPLAVFLHEDLVQMMRAILSRFVKTTEVNNLTTGSKLISYDVSNGLLPMRSIDIGFGASAAIKRIKTLQEQDKLDFYKNCQSLLIALFNLQQRSLVALRRVYDSIKGLNPASITVSHEMMKYARNAHSRYESAKIRDRENRSVAQKRALEKKALSEELKKLQSKRQKKASEIGTELSKIDSDILDLKTKLNNI